MITDTVDQNDIDVIHGDPPFRRLYFAPGIPETTNATGEGVIHRWRYVSGYGVTFYDKQGNFSVWKGLVIYYKQFYKGESTMKKLTVENLNTFIASVSIADPAKGIYEAFFLQ